MVSNVPVAETARIGLTTGDVSPAWLQRALDTLIRNAVGPENSAETTDLAEHLTGAVNTTGHITISTLSPEDIGQWDAVIEIKDSDIAFDESRFSELAAAISLADSRLTFSQVTADAGSGDVSANGFLGLDNINRHQVELDVSSMDFNWLTELAQNLDESDLISLGNNDGNVATLADVQERVDGVLDFRWKMTSEPDRDDPSTANWQANLVGGSEMLTFYGVELNRLGVRLSADQQQIQVSELELALDEKATVRGEGTWQFENNSGSGSIHWQDLSLETIQAMAVVDGAGSGEPVETGGEQQMIPVHGVTAGQVNLRWPVQPSQPTETASMDSVAGTISFRNMEIASFKPKPFRFDIQSDWNNLVLTNFATDDERLNLELKTTVQAEPPYDYDVSGTMKDLALSEFFETSSVVEEEGLTTELTGAAAGQFRIRGTLSPFDWQSNGKLIILSPTVNREAFRDVTVAWERLGSDTKKSRLQIDALGGKMQMVEMSQKPERVRVEISAIDATELTTLFELPVDLTGKLDGDASINDWSLSETRWFDLKLRGSSMVVGQAELGDFQAQAEYRNKQASYGVEGTLLSGKLTGSGETELKLDRLADARFPLDLKLTNVALADLYGESNAFRSLRPLAGSLSATAEFEFPVGELPSGSGRMSVGELKWEQELITREASVRWKINQDRVVLDDVKVDLKRGSVAARASLPIRGGAPGNYDIDIRQLDLKRLTEVWLGDDWEAEGLLDARLSGQLGKTINGQGYVGVDQARVQGVAGQSVRVPVRYRLSPSSSSGRIELRRSRFRLFGGNVSGKADLDFGSRMDLSVDLELSKVNSGEMIQSLFDIDDVDQGQLSGRLKLNGRGIRSARDLEGSFQGSLDRAEAFQLPVLEQIGKFLSTGGLMNREYDSDKIDLRLNRGRIEVRRLNFHNSLARIAINGDVHLDGRLDLSVAAQVDQLNQPTLVEELAGSPLAGLGGNPAAFFASAADFLSNRIVFLRVGGTFARPQVRLDSPQQLREEAVRYFLQNSPLLPASIGRNPNN